MTRQEFKNIIANIKTNTLFCWGIYFEYRKIGDANNYLVLKEYLTALNIYIQSLEYIEASWDYLDILEITPIEIGNCITASLNCIKTFNAKYYE